MHKVETVLKGRIMSDFQLRQIGGANLASSQLAVLNEDQTSFDYFTVETWASNKYPADSELNQSYYQLIENPLKAKLVTLKGLLSTREYYDHLSQHQKLSVLRVTDVISLSE